MKKNIVFCCFMMYNKKKMQSRFTLKMLVVAIRQIEDCLNIRIYDIILIDKVNLWVDAMILII